MIESLVFGVLFLLIVIVPLYCEYRKIRIVTKSNGWGIFATINPIIFITSIDVGDPRCPDYVAREYRVLNMVGAVFFVVWLLAFLVAKKAFEYMGMGF